MEVKRKSKDGANFDEEPLTYEEFTGNNYYGNIMYNNFFYNFSVTHRNYALLKPINPDMAEILSHNNFGRISSEEILEMGYEAYLLLRKNYFQSIELRERIYKYNYRLKSNCADDWPAFFS